MQLEFAGVSTEETEAPASVFFTDLAGRIPYK